MKRALLSGAILAAVGAFIVLATGASKGTAAGTYKIEFDNAFGLVNGADFKVSGVPAGTISGINLDSKSLRALVTVQVTKPGFGQFHSDASCQSRPESLIGEYYVDCNPGSSGPVLKAGSTIPVTHTQSTIPADLLQNIMRLPYRQRFTIIVNELGAAAAGRGGDLQAALRRAVPALTQTDSLLNLLGNDSSTLQALTRDSNSVITALANNSKNVNRFIDEANRTAVATATQQANLRTTLARFPGLLEQLKPTLAQLGTTVTTNQPVLQNLNQASGQLNRLFTDLPAFSRSAQPAIKSLGQASVTGKVAVTAAQPTVKDLNNFAKPTPELAQNLSIVLGDMDTQKRAVEPDPRSPGGKGFSGLQALLWYAFNQTLAINAYGPLGHMLAVDAFFSPMCSPYATPASIALMLKQYGSAYRQCYSWLGPNQPGVNETDPSNPNAPVPDPGGAPPGKYGPSTGASRLTAAMIQGAQVSARKSNSTKTSAPAQKKSTTSASSSSTTTSKTSTLPLPKAPVPGAPPINLKASVGQILAGTVGGAPTPAAPSSAPTSKSSAPGQAQQLLNYHLAP
jgi:virulence factor Mce-like protein